MKSINPFAMIAARWTPRMIMRFLALAVAALAFSQDSAYATITIVVDNASAGVPSRVFATDSDNISQEFDAAVGDTSFNNTASVGNSGGTSSASLQWNIDSSVIDSPVFTVSGSTVSSGAGTGAEGVVLLQITIDEPYAFTLTGSNAATNGNSEFSGINAYSYIQLTGTPIGGVGFGTPRDGTPREGSYYGADYTYPLSGSFSGIMTPGLYELWASNLSNGDPNTESSNLSGSLTLTPEPEPSTLFLFLSGISFAGLCRFRSSSNG
jgi:hypothetical protein